MPQVFKTSCRTRFAAGVGSIPTHSRHRRAWLFVLLALGAGCPAAARAQQAPVGQVDSTGIIHPPASSLPRFRPPAPRPPVHVPVLPPPEPPPPDRGGAELLPRPLHNIPDSVRVTPLVPGLPLHSALDSATVFAVFEPPGQEDGRYGPRAASSGLARRAAVVYPRPGPGWVMLKSVLVPGWGQATNGSWIKAGLAAGLEGYLVAGAFQAGRDVRRISASSDTTSLAEAQGRKVKYVWWTIGAVGISMLDAFVDAHFKNFDVTPIAKRDFPGDDTWLGVRVSFPGVRR